MKPFLNLAYVAVQTLTDGSIVFNVMQGGNEISAPASLHEAQQFCQHFNERLHISAEDVTFNDSEHDYNQGPFLCWVDSKQKALLFANAQATLNALRQILLLDLSGAIDPNLDTILDVARAEVAKTEGKSV